MLTSLALILSIANVGFMTWSYLTSKNAVGSQGLTGQQGSAGPQGSQGLVGPQGLAGQQGEAGPQASGPPKPAEDHAGLVCQQGEAGPQGFDGPQGLAGPQGFDGPQGLVGPQGLAGPQGSQGLVGPQGLAGPQGSQGLVGPQGLAGPQGIQGPAGLKGETGSIDMRIVNSLLEAINNVNTKFLVLNMLTSTVQNMPAAVNTRWFYNHEVVTSEWIYVKSISAIPLSGSIPASLITLGNKWSAYFEGLPLRPHDAPDVPDLIAARNEFVIDIAAKKAEFRTEWYANMQLIQSLSTTHYYAMSNFMNIVSQTFEYYSTIRSV